jgi:predicted DNA-binding transcriptional regulator YafY
MNRIDRLSAILIMLQTKKVVTAAEIGRRFNICLRTVYRDLKALDEAGVPIGAEAGKGYYLVDGYHLPPVMFTSEEAGAMLLAGKLVDGFSDASVRQYYNQAVDKIKAVLPESHREFIVQLESQVQVFHQVDSDTENQSNSFISIIQKALSEHKCIKIQYSSQYNKTCSERIVEPLGLCFYGFKWHLIAFCKLRNDYRDFRLDRINELTVTIDNCLKSQALSISEYFARLWDSKELFNVVVHFDKKILPIISGSRYYFGFYEETEYPDYIEMCFAVNDYNYMANWLLTMGEMVKEIQPALIQEMIIGEVKKLADKYLPAISNNLKS